MIIYILTLNYNNMFTKGFTASDATELSDKINEWIKEERDAVSSASNGSMKFDLIGIKYCSWAAADEARDSALIMFTHIIIRKPAFSIPPDLISAFEDLIYTSGKLWDSVKNIKDTEAMTVTHPIIEAAKIALQEVINQKVK